MVKFIKGLTIQTPARTVSEADIVLFAGLSGDYHPAHTNEVYAKEQEFLGGRVAHGLLTLAISEGLFVRSGVIDWEKEPLVSLGFNDVRFPNPVRPGDTIRSTFSVTDVRESKSRPGWLVVTLKGETKNQKGEIVCSYEHVILVKSEGEKPG
ncbi:MaoC family dehydratase [Sulfodiicoccus acidiphilus]|nr:MaoC family dehydratase [Sulfodiicoccus acidiphilus]